MRVLFMLFFKKRIEAEQGTQKTPKTGKRKSKNDHASAVRVQKLLNRPFFYKGTDPLESAPLPRLSVLPSMWHPFIEMVR
jgi:hypothetical protein